MIINDLKLPNSFINVVQTGKLRRKIGSWLLKRDLDFYGNKLEIELSEIYETKNKIHQQTLELKLYFSPAENILETLSGWEDKPGFIPYINDFSKIVCFGESGDGAPFCFDFRENENQPSVIWWDDVYWRKVAPSFATFIDLFDLNNKR